MIKIPKDAYKILRLIVGMSSSIINAKNVYVSILNMNLDATTMFQAISFKISFFSNQQVWSLFLYIFEALLEI